MGGVEGLLQEVGLERRLGLDDEHVPLAERAP